MKSVAFTAKMTRLNARALLSVEKALFLQSCSSLDLKVSNAFFSFHTKFIVILVINVTRDWIVFFCYENNVNSPLMSVKKNHLLP